MSINYFRPIIQDIDCVLVDSSHIEAERAATPTTTHLGGEDGYLTPKNSPTHPENTLPVPSCPSLISTHVLGTPDFLLMTHPLPDHDLLASLKNPFIMNLFKDDFAGDSVGKKMMNNVILEDQIVTVNKGELRGSVGRGTCNIIVIVCNSHILLH